jgi:hypothetical protein
MRASSLGDQGGTKVAYALADGSHTDGRRNGCRNLRSFVLSLAFAGSILQNMHSVREPLIAARRSQFRQADAMPGVVDPIEESFMHAREMGSRQRFVPPIRT